MKNDFMRPVAWAALCSQGRPGPFVNEYTIHARREDVHKDIGGGNSRAGEDWRAGWRRAYREGWRAIKVRVVPVKKPNA